METARRMEKKMKIAHILTRFDPENNPGGVERVVEELAKRQAKNHQVEIICRNEHKNPEKEIYKDLTVKRASVKDIPAFHTVSSLFSMRKLIRNSEADIFHIHDWSPYINFIFAGSPSKSVLTLHNLEEGIKKPLQNYCSNNADYSVSVSRWLHENTDTDNFIDNGVDTQKFKKGNEGDYALFIGNNGERKGLKPVLEVFERLEYDLKIVGCKDKSKKGMEFLGRVSEKELQDLYQNCGYVVVPSRREGFGLVWAEALACGKPVLCTETGIGPEIPEKYKVMIPREYSVEELEEAVKEIEEKDFESEEIREYAAKTFNWENVSSQYIEVYNNL